MKVSLRSRAALIKHADEEWRDSQVVLVLPFKVLAIVTILLPLVAFIFCVIWSVVNDFEESTATHCPVFNALPSISAAIGAFSPQREVWTIAIALHLPVRYFSAYLYFAYCYRKTWILAINSIEITSLAGLSFVTSSNNFHFHAECFTLFIITSLLFEFMVVYRLPPCEGFSNHRFKKTIFLINVCGAAGAVYFFIRHNMNCEAGIYTLFALSEYVVVLSNMAFHYQARYDFADFELTLHTSSKSDNGYKYQLLTT